MQRHQINSGWVGGWAVLHGQSGERPEGTWVNPIQVFNQINSTMMEEFPRFRPDFPLSLSSSSCKDQQIFLHLLSGINEDVNYTFTARCCVREYVCVCVCAYVREYACVCVCVYVREYVRVCVCVTDERRSRRNDAGIIFPKRPFFGSCGGGTNVRERVLERLEKELEKFIPFRAISCMPKQRTAGTQPLSQAVNSPLRPREDDPLTPLLHVDAITNGTSSLAGKTPATDAYIVDGSQLQRLEKMKRSV